jgi:hypothetical protein
MRRELVRLGLAASAVGGLVAISACSGGGSGPPSGSERASVVLPRVTAAVKAARSVHVMGRVAAEGRTATLDVSFFGSTGFVGTVSDDGAMLGVLLTDGKTYIKINSAFLALAKLPKSACKAMCGKYVLIPAADAQGLIGAMSMSGLLNSVFGKLPHTAGGDYFMPATYHGQSVLEFRQNGYSLIVERSSPQAHGSGNVSQAGDYPLAITAPHGEYLAFSEWNTVALPTPPPASKTVKLSSFG